MPVAGRSRMPSWHPLSACPLRFAILASLAPIARLSGTGSPSLHHPGRDSGKGEQPDRRHAQKPVTLVDAGL